VSPEILLDRRKTMPEFQGPIVISRDATAAGSRRDFEDALAAALRAGGNEVWVIPPLYYLRPSHPAARYLSGKADGDLLIASWLPPRAAFWTLQALGVSGSPGPDAAALRPASQKSAGTPEERTVCCLCLANFASVEACGEALKAAAARVLRGSPCAQKRAGELPALSIARRPPSPAGAGEAEEIAEPAEARWYPVIDYSLCSSCRKCVDFCLFGVYSAGEERVAVTSPDNCKNGCPACARTCPRGAIMFPHYFADPAIAGAESPNRDPRAVSLPQREGEDTLDRLIGALERLDG
jgi:hypothetical protein